MNVSCNTRKFLIINQIKDLTLKTLIEQPKPICLGNFGPIISEHYTSIFLSMSFSIQWVSIIHLLHWRDFCASKRHDKILWSDCKAFVIVQRYTPPKLDLAILQLLKHFARHLQRQPFLRQTRLQTFHKASSHR
jgi:hypothetical protein